jgi:DNA-binding CsgD family transcriptional regulator
MNLRLELYKEASRIWNKAASRSKFDCFNFETELHEKLLNLFHVGSYYYSIFNYAQNDFEFVSAEVKSVLGYAPSAFNIPFLLNAIHPEDIDCLLNNENRAIDFLKSLPVEKLMKYKIRSDYRFRKSDGYYVRLLQQGMVLEHDENGGILRTLIIHTDITGIKEEGKPVLCFIGMEGEPSYINVDVKKVFTVSKDVLTGREKQVLALLIEGMLSKEIADILKISKETVGKHRKNMLSKNQLKSTGELIAKAIRQGWL